MQQDASHPDRAGGPRVVVPRGRCYKHRAWCSPRARRNGVEAMIEAGLQPGERVVVYPSDALKDGARVSVRR